MSQLRTRWGTYILSNALKIDIYPQKALKNWDVYFSIDSFKHLLMSFESECDSVFFCSCLKDYIHDCLERPYESPWELDKYITLSLEETEHYL